jgi:hypothetical protein
MVHPRGPHPSLPSQALYNAIKLVVVLPPLLGCSKEREQYSGAMIGENRQLGPLHTRAKSRDHEIVRAQKKVSKGCPKTPPRSCNVVMDPQV